MNALSQPHKHPALETIAQLQQAIQELMRLEEASQEILKQPAERLLDGLGVGLDGLEERKAGWMASLERRAVELAGFFGPGRPPTGGELREAHGRMLLALRHLERMHQDNEKVLGLRMALLAEDMRQIERSRRFLRSTLQSVAA